MSELADRSKKIAEHYKPIGLKAVAAAARSCSGTQTSGGQQTAQRSPDDEKVRES